MYNCNNKKKKFRAMYVYRAYPSIPGCLSHKQVDKRNAMREVWKLVYHLGKIRTHWHTKQG